MPRHNGCARSWQRASRDTRRGNWRSWSPANGRAGSRSRQPALRERREFCRREIFAIDYHLWRAEMMMMIPKQDLAAALARLAEAFPQTFVLEKHRPHRPLKIGIAADISARCPAVERRVLSVALRVYTRRVMYLQSLVAGAARVDLDGK